MLLNFSMFKHQMLSTLKALDLVKSYVNKEQMVATLLEKNIYAVSLSSTMNRSQLLTFNSCRSACNTKSFQ